jgi:hypothetical protein
MISFIIHGSLADIFETQSLKKISWGVAPGYINLAPLGISWGVAPGYINLAPLGLKEIGYL